MGVGGTDRVAGVLGRTRVRVGVVGQAATELIGGDFLAGVIRIDLGTTSVSGAGAGSVAGILWG